MKTCTICKLEKEDIEFYLKRGNGRQNKCIVCSKIYNKAHYIKDKDKYLTRASRRNALDRVWRREISNSLKSRPCADCKIQYPPYIMDFDHITDTKLANVSEMFASGYSLEKIEKEIAKCEVVCSNCHRSRTYKRKQQT